MKCVSDWSCYNHNLTSLICSGNPLGAMLFAGDSESYVEVPQRPAFDTQYSITIMTWVYLTEQNEGPIVYFILG